MNDPATGAAALAHVHDLLSILVTRELDVGRVHDSAGELRVDLHMPTWDEFLETGVDDLIHYGREAPLVRRRLLVLIDDLTETAPPDRVPAVRQRLLALTEPVTLRSTPADSSKEEGFR